jgi:hypothetical protein
MRKGVVICLLVPVAMLSACGGSGSSKSDKDKITDLINDVAKNPVTLCTTYATPSLLIETGGPAACRRLASKAGSQDPDVKIESIAITGSRATAKVTGNRGHQEIGLIKQRGAWKAAAVIGNT